MHSLMVLLCLAALMLSSQSALAADTEGAGPMIKRKKPPPGIVNLSATLGTGLPDGLGYGARVSFRILPRGFIGAINDSVAIEVSGFRAEYTALYGLFLEDFTYTRTFVLGGMRWDFHAFDRWTFFGLPELGYATSSNETLSSSSVAYGGSVGAFFHASRFFALRGEYESAVRKYQIGFTLKL